MSTPPFAQVPGPVPQSPLHPQRQRDRGRDRAQHRRRRRQGGRRALMSRQGSGHALTASTSRTATCHLSHMTGAHFSAAFCAALITIDPACASPQHATSSRLSRLSALPAPMDVNGTANGTPGMNGNGGGYTPHLQTDPSKGAQPSPIFCLLQSIFLAYQGMPGMCAP